MDHSLERPWVHLAVHKRVRELDAKLFLALGLVLRHFNVVIGRTGKLRPLAARLPKGTYCDIRVLITRLEVFKHWRSLDHKIVALDEEATSFSNKELYQARFISTDVVSLCEAVFSWGPYHSSTLQGVVQNEPGSVVRETGHPRFDMLREPVKNFYQKQENAIHAEYGKFFLINSNAGGWIIAGDRQRWRHHRL